MFSQISAVILESTGYGMLLSYIECNSESGDVATLFFRVRQHWGGCRYRHFAANFKAF
jgi:hypothetical protein